MRRFLGHLRKSFRIILGPKSHFARPAVFVLGLGLGSVSIVFSLFDQTLLQVVPGVPGQDRLAYVTLGRGFWRVARASCLWERPGRPLCDAL